MADIRDFISSMGNESTASMAYLLLMANIFGLVVYLDSRKSESMAQKEVLPSDDSATTNSIVPQVMPKTEEISDSRRQLEKAQAVEDGKTEDRFQETPNVELAPIKNKKEQLKNTDNVIDFKEAVATRTQEAKEPLKPLVWKFPKSIL